VNGLQNRDLEKRFGRGLWESNPGTLARFKEGNLVQKIDDTLLLVFNGLFK
jgi:hypothetical protein